MATPTVVLLPIWGAGHLMSMLDAGKRLLGRSGHALSLTVLVIQAPTESYRSEVAGHISREEASGLDIHFIHLPAVEPPTDFVGPEDFFSRYVQLHGLHVKAAISGLTCPVAAFVIDFFGTTLLDVSRELAVPAYVYFTSNAALYALLLRLPALHEEVTVEFEEMEGTVDVPGLPPVPPSSLPSPVMDKKNPNYTWFVYHGRRFMEANGVIINTAAELEQSVLSAIADGRCTRGVPAPTVYPIGPVLSFSPPAQEPHECVRWLDAQPPASVVLLCFGSGGFSTAPQAHEIAHGLERSGHRFLWVLRGPPAAGAGGPQGPTDANLEELLPEGFLERTKETGMVWPTRAPQKEILAHGAVGAFVTHCGWNSILESLWFGVPMVPWPLYAEQHLNAFTLVTYFGVAVAMKVDRKRNNFVDASELERAVKTVMGDSDEGRKARKKAMEMKVACRKAVEEGGSCSALERLSEEMRKGALRSNRKICGCCGRGWWFEGEGSGSPLCPDLGWLELAKISRPMFDQGLGPVLRCWRLLQFMNAIWLEARLLLVQTLMASDLHGWRWMVLRKTMDSWSFCFFFLFESSSVVMAIAAPYCLCTLYLPQARVCTGFYLV